MSTDRNFNRAQAQYDAQEEPGTEPCYEPLTDSPWPPDAPRDVRRARKIGVETNNPEAAYIYRTASDFDLLRALRDTMSVLRNKERSLDAEPHLREWFAEEIEEIVRRYELK